MDKLPHEYVPKSLRLSSAPGWSSKQGVVTLYAICIAPPGPAADPRPTYGPTPHLNEMLEIIPPCKGAQLLRYPAKTTVSEVLYTWTGGSWKLELGKETE